MLRLCVAEDTPSVICIFFFFYTRIMAYASLAFDCQCSAENPPATGTKPPWAVLCHQARVLICLLLLTHPLIALATIHKSGTAHFSQWDEPAYILTATGEAAASTCNSLIFLELISQSKANKPPKTLTAVQTWLRRATGQQIHYILAKSRYCALGANSLAQDQSRLSILYFLSGMNCQWQSPRTYSSFGPRRYRSDVSHLQSVKHFLPIAQPILFHNAYVKLGVNLFSCSLIKCGGSLAGGRKTKLTRLKHCAKEI